MANTAPGMASRNLAQTYHYFGWLTLFIYLATPVGYLVDIQTSYVLKNQLHATATQVSLFRLITAMPVYFGFIFGLIRDQWNPFGLRDRGYFLIFGPATALAFLWMAYSGFSYQGLLLGMLLTMIMFRFSTAAYQGLISLVGQEGLMSGRLAVLWQVVSTVPVLLGALTSGYVSEHFRPRESFTLMAALALCVGLIGLWKPTAVFGDVYEKPQARKADFIGNVKRLVKHRAIYPAIVVMLLFNFAPGSQTPLQYYLTNTLHASDAVYSYYTGIFATSFVPTFLLYGFLCRKVPLNKLLWWGTIITVPQMVPLALINSGTGALYLAVPIGMMGGMATAAYYDLAMRSCPPALQGTLMMLVEGVYILAQRASDLLGSRIYNSSPEHGFLYCVIATTIVYALILPVILLVPKELIATRDGEASPLVELELLEEIADAGPA